MMILTLKSNVPGFTFVTSAILLLLLAPWAGGQVITADPDKPELYQWSPLVLKTLPRVADPKLDNGEIPISFGLNPVGETYQVSIRIMKDAQLYREVFSGPLQGAGSQFDYAWDGMNDQDEYADPGDYTVLIEAEQGTTWSVSRSVSIVRLGITEMRALPGAFGDEWQMVYFTKAFGYGFFATPAICEYANKARSGDVSDLDNNDGTAKKPVQLHRGTACPVMNGNSYETDCYNYPVCYRMGCTPILDITMGDTCTSSQGTSIPCGYPVFGVQIRCIASDLEGEWICTSENISPGSEYTFEGPALPATVTRTDRRITWSWQYKTDGQFDWHDIPGDIETDHRFYTILGDPVWANGASGTQYAGPWVEVMEYFYTWSVALGFDTSTEEGVVKTLVRGYFGQEGSLTEAIEGIIYDTYVMGGDGGASHYYGSSKIQLSRLLNKHGNGVYVNCSDVAGSASAMIGMFGVQGIQMLRLGQMYLRAIWGVGCPDYTLDLWGHGSHGFSYHHIMTRDGGTHVSDACMWLDEDGDPDSLPGTPGYNHDRPWNHVREGYNQLSASNNVSKTLNALPEIN